VLPFPDARDSQMEAACVILSPQSSVISISASGCVRSSKLSRYVTTMAKEAMLADRMTCRSSSNVGLSAQRRSSKKRNIGRARDATASMTAAASNRRYRWPSSSADLVRDSG
jgi:hypothetical protein